MLEQLCRLVDLLFGQTGITEHECCSRRLDRRRIVRRKRVNAHTDRLCARNKFVLEHAVAHVQQQVQAGFRARDLMRQVGQLAVKRSHERVAACLIDLAAAADVPLEAAGVHEGRQRVLVKARHGRRVTRKPFAIARHQRIRQHQIADAQSGGKAFRKGVDVHDTACPIQLA